jgi:hypothetical protein
METLKLLIGIDEIEIFERAAKDMQAAQCSISYDKQPDKINAYALLSAPTQGQIGRVIFWAGYLKACDLHKSLKTA